MYYLFASRIGRIMKLVIAIIVCLSQLNLVAQEYDKSRVLPTELEHLTGLYTGQLQYKDYGDGQITTIKLLGNCYFKNETLYLETIINERGKIYRNKMKFRLKNGQIHYGGMTKLTSKVIDYKAQVMELEFVRKGRDNKKPVELKFEFKAGLNNIVLSKWVKAKDNKEFFKRNEYSFQRY